MAAARAVQARQELLARAARQELLERPAEQVETQDP